MKPFKSSAVLKPEVSSLSMTYLVEKLYSAAIDSTPIRATPAANSIAIWTNTLIFFFFSIVIIIPFSVDNAGTYRSMCYFQYIQPPHKMLYFAFSERLKEAMPVTSQLPKYNFAK